ncbi:hypothetical protein LTS10_013229 [Elasticomyces elasticus]|nr:hypothetical protein LTS10_013229 [Elasticomyces elasticus]
MSVCIAYELIKYLERIMCIYTDPVCPSCEGKHRTVITTCSKYSIRTMCSDVNYGPFLFMFHDKCSKKYLTKSSKLSTGELSFLTSTKPMNMDKIIHLLTANLTSCSTCDTTA